MNLLDNVRIVRGINAMSSKSSAIGNEIDTAGYEGIMFVAHGSSLMIGTSEVYLKAKGSTASGGTFVAYDTYAASTKMATNSFDYKILALDISKPLKRYVKAVVGGASSSQMHTRAIDAILYNGRKPIITDSTLVGGSVVAVAATSS